MLDFQTSHNFLGIVQNWFGFIRSPVKTSFKDSNASLTGYASCGVYPIQFQPSFISIVSNSHLQRNPLWLDHHCLII